MFCPLRTWAAELIVELYCWFMSWKTREVEGTEVPSFAGF